MIGEQDGLEIIINRIPEFRDFWSEADENGAREICQELSLFARYIAKLLSEKNSAYLAVAFGTIEQFLNEGDFELRNAAASCFLEDLVNLSSHGHFPSKSFVSFLGSKSREVIADYDRFTGVSTEGI